MLSDRGYREPEGTKGPEQALAKGDFKFNLEGERLHGGCVLVRMAHDGERNKRTNWLLIINRTCWLSGQGVSRWRPVVAWERYEHQDGCLSASLEGNNITLVVLKVWRLFRPLA